LISNLTLEPCGLLGRKLKRNIHYMDGSQKKDSDVLSTWQAKGVDVMRDLLNLGGPQESSCVLRERLMKWRGTD